jgi:hypothetical protein
VCRRLGSLLLPAADFHWQQHSHQQQQQQQQQQPGNDRLMGAAFSCYASMVKAMVEQVHASFCLAGVCCMFAA